MNQFEFDQLSILAGSFEIEATNALEPIARVCRRHGAELRDLLRQMRTEPAVEGEPTSLPPMRWPSDRPTLNEDPT